MPAMPALLTRTSTLRSTRPLSQRTSDPKHRRAAAVEIPDHALAPEACERLTIAAPMPCAPPVTIAFRPAKSSRFMGTRSIIAAFHGRTPRRQDRVHHRRRPGHGPAAAAALAFARGARGVGDRSECQDDQRSSREGRHPDARWTSPMKRRFRKRQQRWAMSTCSSTARDRAHGSILDATPKDWDQAFAVNVKSMFSSRAPLSRGC